MVQSKALTVDDYLAEADDVRRAALERFRSLAREVLVGWTEGMDYGMAAYRKGEAAVHLANQKQYIALYAGRSVIDRHADRLAGIDCGKSCIRYKNVAKIDFEVVRLLFETIREKAP